MADYPAGLVVQRMKEMDKETLGAFLHIDMLQPETVLSKGPALGVMMVFGLTIAPGISRTANHLFTGQKAWGWSNMFAKPWTEVVRDGSPHFPGDKLEVKATAKLVFRM